MAGCGFLGPAELVGPYTMLDCGGYPGLVQLPEGQTNRVCGELYAVDASCLSVLDAYEAVDSGEYLRREIRVCTESGARVPAQAYFYALPVDGLPDIGGMWTQAMEAAFCRGGPPSA